MSQRTEMDAGKFYREVPEWWPLFSPPEDYEEEAGIYLELLTEACDRSPETLLELGSGGGNNALYMKEELGLTLTDLAPGMLAVSRKLNPECEHIEGDMRTLRLERQFDLVFAHDAICYLTSEQDVRQTIETAWVHCAPGGAVLFAPDFVRETFREDTEEGGHESDDGRALHYLAWCQDPDPDDSTYQVDYAFLLRDTDGQVTSMHQQHLEGLFSRDDWLRWLGEVGFEAWVVPLEHSDVEEGVHEMFVGKKPGG